MEALFRQTAPMAADTQKETFQSVLADALEDACDYQVVQAVHDQLCGMVQANKENKDEAPLTVSRSTVERVLQDQGVPQERVEEFSREFDRQFGEEAELSPRNIVSAGQTEVKTPDVRIQVNPERGDLVETRIIDGARYILIRAEESVEVNGVPICIR